MTDREVLWRGRDAFKEECAAMIWPVATVLDIGCGIRPQTYLRPALHICVDPWPEYLDRLSLETSATPERVLLCCDWEHAVSIFPGRSVDTVFLLDVVEHVEKEKAKELLSKTLEIARYQVLVYTPLGFMPQSHPDGVDAWGLRGGHLQEHRSGWLPHDFGSEWELCACRDYHTKNSRGETLPTPYGALFAVWSRPGATPPHSRVPWGVRTTSVRWLGWIFRRIRHGCR